MIDNYLLQTAIIGILDFKNDGKIPAQYSVIFNLQHECRAKTFYCFWMYSFTGKRLYSLPVLQLNIFTVFFNIPPRFV